MITVNKKRFKFVCLLASICVCLVSGCHFGEEQTEPPQEEMTDTREDLAATDTPADTTEQDSQKETTVGAPV